LDGDSDRVVAIHEAWSDHAEAFIRALPEFDRVNEGIGTSHEALDPVAAETLDGMSWGDPEETS
jgi:hypothetical protein